MRRLGDKPQAVHKGVRSTVGSERPRCRWRGSPFADGNDDPCCGSEWNRHQQQQTFRTETACKPRRNKAGENASENSSAPKHSKQALGLPCRPEKVRKSPDLRGRKSTDDAHPHV